MIDGLVELLIQLGHKISVRAEKKVENEIVGEFRRVHCKNGILVNLAETALELPEEIGAEQALISVIATSYLLGVSTRRVDKLVEQLGIKHISKSQVSQMAKVLDESTRPAPRAWSWSARTGCSAG